MNTIKTILSAMLLALITSTVSAQTALPPPPSNIVVLDDTAKLVWTDTNAPGTLAGFQVKLTNPAGSFSTATTFTNILLRQITTNLPSGTYSAEVLSVKLDGIRSTPATTSTNIGTAPAKVFNVRFEGTLTILP